MKELIQPIKVPLEISMLSKSLPHATYDGFPLVPMIDTSSKLPNIKSSIKKPYNYMDNFILSSTERMKRIREIYLAPCNLYLSPQIKKSLKYVGHKKKYF